MSEKVFMECVIHENYRQWEEFVRTLPDLFERGGETLHDGRNCIKAFDVEGTRLVVKRFRQPNPFNRLVYTFFRGSKAERAYRNALRLEELDVQTPAPIAYLNLERKGLLSICYLVTTYTDYAPILDIEREPLSVAIAAFDAFVHYTVELHEKGVRHDDYNLTNVLYRRQADGSFRFELIDVNRMHFGPLSRRQCLSNVIRMCASMDITYYMSKRYAEVRGWNAYRVLATMAIIRGLFERRRQRRKQLKAWAERCLSGRAPR